MWPSKRQSSVFARRLPFVRPLTICAKAAEPVTQLASSLDVNIQSKDNSSEAIQKSEALEEKADPDKIMETVMGLINEKPAQISSVRSELRGRRPTEESAEVGHQTTKQFKTGTTTSVKQPSGTGPMHNNPMKPY